MFFRPKPGTRCQHCGMQIAQPSKFCPHCGKPLAGGTIVCPQCQATIPADSNFCPQCRTQLRGDAVPQMRGYRWAKEPPAFAAHIEVDDIPAMLQHEIIVEPGTRAILLVDGRAEGELGPGRYKIDDRHTLWAKIRGAKHITAVLVDAGDVAMDFAVPGLYTADPIRITAECRMRVGLKDAVRFLVNWMKGQRSISVDQIRRDLFDEVQNALAEVVRNYTVRDLDGRLELKEQIAASIELHLKETFETMGLSFSNVRALNFRHERWDALQGKKEDLFLRATEDETALTERRHLLEVLQEQDLLDLADETRKTEGYEKRAQLWSRMRRAVMSDKMDQALGEEEFEKFLSGLDRDRLLREEEIQNLRRDVAARQEDWQRARAFLLAKAQVEETYELRMLELACQRELTTRQKELGAEQRDLILQQLELEQEVERRRAEGQLALEERRFTARLEQGRMEALAQAEIEDVERAGEEKDLEMGLRALQRVKAIKAEEARQQLELQLAAEERRLELELRRFREEREAELRRMQQLATMSAEALVAASGEEQARLLVELRRTEALNGMSEEQILAMAAERSPEVARAFQEKFRSLPAQEQREMYERLVQAEKGSREEQARLMRDMMATMERLFGQAAEAVARRPETAPTVIMGPAGPVALTGASATPAGWVCRRCHTTSPVGTKYCPNCGEAFFE